jgi:hypothetical protein
MFDNRFRPELIQKHFHDLCLKSKAMKKSPLKNLVLVLAIAFLGYGCNKEKEEVDYDTQSSQDNAQAENILNEINEIADQAVEDGLLSTHRFASGNNFLSSCGSITVTVDSTDSSGTATIDFGTHFCKGIDTKFRKGKITVSFTGPYREAGTVITIAATNYFVGYDSAYATKVNGQRTVTNNGTNGNGNLSYSIQANATLANYLNEQMTWSSTRNREWTAGVATSAWNDDEYLITGNASGKSFGGVNFSASITEALHVKLNCRWITEGTFSLTPENKEPRTLDYGDGACDNDATVTIKDKTYNITIR